MNHHNINNPQNNQQSFIQQPGQQVRPGQLHMQTHGSMQQMQPQQIPQQMSTQAQQMPLRQPMSLRPNFDPAMQAGTSQRLPVQQQIRKTTPQQQQGGEQPKTFQDPVNALKQLLPEMRQSLVTLMQAASQNFSKNLVADDSKTNFNSTTLPRLDEHLEKFFMINDEVSLYLRMIVQQNIQVANNHTIPPNYQLVNLKEHPNRTDTYSTVNSYIDQQKQYMAKLHAVMSSFSRQLEVRRGNEQMDAAE